MRGERESRRGGGRLVAPWLEGGGGGNNPVKSGVMLGGRLGTAATGVTAVLKVMAAMLVPSGLL